MSQQHIRVSHPSLKIAVTSDLGISLQKVAAVTEAQAHVTF